VKAGEIVEEVTHFDRDSMSVTYLVLAGLPGFMRRVENAWNIEKIEDNSCRITSSATFEMAWWILLMTPLMKIQMKGAIKSFLKELKATAEKN
jgi:ribosome-associated toxin RatA of RatAB toxin-antitoxin module